MQKFGLWLVAIAASLLSVSVYAGDVQVEAATVRATAPGQQTAMGDLSITSKQIALLVGVSTPVAQSVEMHLMSHDNGMMKMREVQEIPLPAGRMMNLNQEGYHLMLMNLQEPIMEGASVPLTLTIRLANKKTIKLETTATVKPLIVIDSAEHTHMHP